MFIDKAKKSEVEKYISLLKAAGYITKLSTNSEGGIMRRILDSTTLEIIFSQNFKFNDVSKKDEAIDCYKDGLGVGLKTFGCDGLSKLEKIAEFNEKSDFIYELRSSPEKVVRFVAGLRNDRIQTTIDRYNLSNIIYHCITRNRNGNWYVIEEPMHTINVNKFIIEKQTDKVIDFRDDHGSYKFNFSKSVIMKRFNNAFPFKEFHVEIAENPFEILEKISKS